jgi:hypothetical protein
MTMADYAVKAEVSSSMAGTVAPGFVGNRFPVQLITLRDIDDLKATGRLTENRQDFSWCSEGAFASSVQEYDWPTSFHAGSRKLSNKPLDDFFPLGPGHQRGRRVNVSGMNTLE